jgi:hypothetical protein
MLTALPTPRKSRQQPLTPENRQLATDPNLFLTFSPLLCIIVQRGINATVRLQSLAGYRFRFLRAGLRSCRPLFRALRAR